MNTRFLEYLCAYPFSVEEARIIRGGDTISLKSQSAGKRLDMKNEDAQGISDDSKWQRMVVEKDQDGPLLQGEPFFLMTAWGTHVDVEDGKVRSRWRDHGDLQRLVLEKEDGHTTIQHGDAVFLKADPRLPLRGRARQYVSIEDSQIFARFEERRDWQQMLIEKAGMIHFDKLDAKRRFVSTWVWSTMPRGSVSSDDMTCWDITPVERGLYYTISMPIGGQHGTLCASTHRVGTSKCNWVFLEFVSDLHCLTDRHLWKIKPVNGGQVWQIVNKATDEHLSSALENIMFDSSRRALYAAKFSDHDAQENEKQGQWKISPHITPKGLGCLHPTSKGVAFGRTFSHGQRVPFQHCQASIHDDLVEHLRDAILDQWGLSKLQEGNVRHVAEWHTVTAFPESADLFVPRLGTGQTSVPRAPLVAVAFAEAFREINSVAWQNVVDRLEVLAANNHSLELRGACHLFVDAVNNGRHFGVLEIQHYYGEEHNCGRHIDGVTSLLHLALTLNGVRQLTLESYHKCNSYPSEEKEEKTKAKCALTLELRRGDVYLSSPSLFDHQVVFPKCGLEEPQKNAKKQTKK
eukprot:gnl/MRDRNA2_/MRDRNA2_75745_c0_seq2.p1 gnl/MRDRNA2_/MRDRNA2_75745_c0~~gnl/MRDRNA2_/MRDRNA2_75745_c0_seq2.p1  ORF type:complete len:575 (+),score=105.63 gnl/MRDRNA2_/MRDRNA2_75745_c0_seq2:73-1797(+)